MRADNKYAAVDGKCNRCIAFNAEKVVIRMVIVAEVNPSAHSNVFAIFYAVDAKNRTERMKRMIWHFVRALVRTRQKYEYTHESREL